MMAKCGYCGKDTGHVDTGNGSIYYCDNDCYNKHRSYRLQNILVKDREDIVVKVGDGTIKLQVNEEGETEMIIVPNKIKDEPILSRFEILDL